MQTNPADVSELITDPADLGTSSAILLEQTVVIPAQGKVLITKSLLMTSFINTIVTLGSSSRSNYSARCIPTPEKRNCSKTSKSSDLSEFALSILNFG
jgi:hypothetical protein